MMPVRFGLDQSGPPIVGTILTLFGLLATLATAGDSPRFIPYDASRLMGSPVPIPLDTEVAYPNLKFERPVELTHAGDGSNRVFIVEQRGLIHVFPNAADVKSTRVFLDIRKVVSRDGNEEGLLGLAFHPNYRQNGLFYVYYSTRPRASILSEYRVSQTDPNRADIGSERVLMTIAQPFGNHNGGSIKFGPDRYLYIGLGDGGAANDPFGNGQNLKTLLASILRIDVDHRSPGKQYAIPKDNPFAGHGDRARGEIWAYGIRNAWRLSFDRKTGQLWTGDVGQNRYEEVNRITRGGNYGWNIREGFHPFQTGDAKRPNEIIDPLVEYFRHEGVSVTGGLVYRGKRLPDYRGAYFYGDYVSGNVWIVRLNDKNQIVDNRKVARTGLNIAAFGDDESGEMYLCAFDGQIHRLRKKAGDLEAIAQQFPRKLSETGLFADTAAERPAACMISYDINVPLWSDSASKSRFFTLPKAASVHFDATKALGFPVGAVLAKTFYLPVVSEPPPKDKHAAHPTADLRSPTGRDAPTAPLRRLETRLIVHTPDGWNGYTYVWNQAQTDAVLLDGARTVRYQVADGNSVHPQDWYYPSQSDCMACHVPGAGFVLGPRTRQLNRPDRADPSVNQLDRFRHLGIFSNPFQGAPAQLEAYPDWRSAADQPVDKMARAYLDANCAMCHSRHSIVQVPDLRFDLPLERMKLLGRQTGQGRIGPAGVKIITPGDPMRSELLHRISRRGPRQMPPLATNQDDLKAIRILMRWIDSLADHP